MFAPSVAPAERRPAAPREEIDGKGGGEKAIKTERKRRRRRERERRGLPSEERKRKGSEERKRLPTNQTLIQRGSGNSRRRWRRPTIFCIGYVATDAMATGCSRRCRRHRRRASLPMKDMRLARYYHSLAAAAAAACRTSNQGRRPPLVGLSDGLGTKSRKENDQASDLRVPSVRLTAPAPGDSGYDFLTAAAPVGGGQHEVRTDGAGHRRHSARAHASLLCRIISR